MFRNILVAYDGSPHADQGLTHAVELARAGRGELALMTGPDELPESAYPSMSEPDAPLIEDPVGQAEALLDRARARIPEDVPVTTIIATEPIRSALTRRIEEADHDLLVIGSRGHGMLQGALLGSLSHYAVQHSGIPVLVVHVPGD